MQGKVDGSGQRNGYSIQGNLTGLKFGPLLQDLIGNQRVDGLANLQVDMQTDGNTVEAIKRSLSGTLSFEFRDGLFNGFNLANLISTARARLLNEGAAESAGGETKFSRFAASFSAKNGVFAGKSFNLSAGGFSADGSGSYDLAANNLDYTIATRISEDIGNDKLQKLAGLTVPIKLSGDLFAPGYNVDIKSAMQGLAQQKLQAEKDKAKAALQQRVDEERQELQEKIGEKRGELNDKVQQKLQKGLSDLFGGSSKKEEAAEQPAPEEAQ
jgi:AsmA protein